MLKKALASSILTVMLLTGCAAHEGKITVVQDANNPESIEDANNPESTEFILTEKEQTVKATVMEEQESSVSLFLINHMVKHGLPKQTAESYADYIIEASDKYLVDPFTVLSIIHVETGGTFRFKNHPNSHGAIGLMQILKQNVECNENNSCVQDVWVGYSVQDLYDPKKNIELGTKYLKYLQDRFGHDLGIVAYNQGEGNVERGTYRTWYFDKVHEVFKSIEGNDYDTKSSPKN